MPERFHRFAKLSPAEPGRSSGACALLVGLIVVSQIALAPALARADRGYEPVDWMGPDARNIVATLPFAPTGAAFDARRGLLYLSSSEARRLVAVELSRGSIAWSLDLEQEPTGLAISADGAELLLGLRAEGPVDGSPRASGWIGLVALDAPAAPRRVRVPVDPFDIATRSDGSFVVSTGSVSGATLASVSDTSTRPRIDTWTGSLPPRGTLTADPVRLMAFLSYSSWEGYAAATLGFELRPGQAPAITGALEADNEYGDPYAAHADPTGRWLVTTFGSVFSLEEEDRFGRWLFVDGLRTPRRISAIGFDSFRRLILAAFDGGIEYFNLDTLEPVAGPRDFGFISHIAVVDLDIYAIQDFYGEPRLLRFDHPVPHGDTNERPTALATFGPTIGPSLTTRHPIRLDGAASWDRESGLSHAWDLDGDGAYDDAFGQAVDWRFDTAGSYSVGLKVVDDAGATDETTIHFDVAFESDPGSTPPIRSPFALPTPLADAVIDARHERAYVASAAEAEIPGDPFVGRLDVYDLVSGLSIRSYRLRPIARLALSPDHRSLYIGQYDPDARSYSDPPRGWLAALDVDSLRIEGNLEIPIGPSDIVATDRGVVMVTPRYQSGSSRPSLLIDPRTGNTSLGPFVTSSARNIALHPSQRRVYTVIQSTPYRIDLLADETLEVRWGSERTHAFGGVVRVWVHPDGAKLISDTGILFDATGETAEQDLRIERTLWDRSADRVQDVAFDVDRGIWITGDANGLVYRNLISFEAFGEHRLGGAVRHIGIGEEYVYAVVEHEEEAGAPPLGGTALTEIQRVPHPAPTGLHGEAPKFKLSLSAIRAAIDAPVRVDVWNSKASGEALSYRWDLDGDGVWDTGFSTEATLARAFETAGSKFIRVQAKNGAGWVSEQTVQIDVLAPEILNGSSKRASAFRLDFPVTDLEFDPWRPRIYAASASRRTLYVVDGESGLVERRIRFDRDPVQIYLQPGARRLYVLLRERAHTSARNDPAGAIAIVSMDTFETLSIIETEGSPKGVAATEKTMMVFLDDGIRFFDADTLERVHTDKTIHAPPGLVYDEKRRLFLVLTIRRDHVTTIDPDSGEERVVGFSAGRGDAEMAWLESERDLLVRADGYVQSVNAIESVWLDPPTRLTSERIHALAFDPRRNAFVLGVRNSLDFYNADSLELVESVAVPSTPDFIAVDGLDVVWVANEIGYADVSRTPHQLTHADHGRRPTANLEVAPTAASIGAPVLLDASASRAHRDGSLSFRWDLDDDGTWDTEFAAEMTATIETRRAGTRFVRVQVRDEAGFVDVADAMIHVRPDPDTGPRPDMALPIPASQVLFDPKRALAYVSNEERGIVYTIDLATGYVRDRTEFARRVRSLALSESGDQLLAALSLASPRLDWPIESQRGLLVTLEIDDGLRELRQSEIPIDPASLVSLGGGRLLATPASGERGTGRLAILDEETGQRLDIDEALARVGDAGYADGADFGPPRSVASFYSGSGPTIQRYGLAEGGGLDEGWVYLQTSRCGRKALWTDPDRTLLATSAAELFSIGAMEFEADLQPLADWSSVCWTDRVVDVLFEQDRDELTILQRETLRSFSLTGLFEVSSQSRTRHGRALGRVGDALVVIEDDPLDRSTWISFPERAH